MTAPLRLLLADAAPLQRAGLRAVLTGAPIHPHPHRRDDSPAGPRNSTGVGFTTGQAAGELGPGEVSHWRTDPGQATDAVTATTEPIGSGTAAGTDRRTGGGAPAAEIVIAGEAGDGVEAVDLARRLLPDVLITDVALPRMDGLAVTRAITEARLPIRVLILTDDDSDDEVVAAVDAGAAAYLRRDSPHHELVSAVHAVAAGGAVITPLVLARILTRLTGALPAPADGIALDRLSPLTTRERQVLIQVARGHSNSEIAGSLGVSETTVKTHVNHVLTKLRLRDRTQAVVLAYETGLVRPTK